MAAGFTLWEVKEGDENLHEYSIVVFFKSTAGIQKNVEHLTPVVETTITQTKWKPQSHGMNKNQQTQEDFDELNCQEKQAHDGCKESQPCSLWTGGTSPSSECGRGDKVCPRQRVFAEMRREKNQTLDDVRVGCKT